MSIDGRDFMKFSALGALAAAADPQALLGQDAGQIPNMAKQARPITREEYVERQERARRYMHDAGIAAIMLIGGTSLNYFTGTQWGTSERMFACIIPAKGEMAFVTPAFEKDRALEQIKFSGDVRTWQEDESPYRLVAQILKDRGITNGKLGIEETMDYRFSDGVAKAAPAIELTSADPVTARCRRVKTAHELELIRRANQTTLQAYEGASK